MNKGGESSQPTSNDSIRQFPAMDSSAKLNANSSDGTASSAFGTSTTPASSQCTYNSSDRDDTITDEDIEFFLGEKSSTTSAPATCSHLSSVQPVPESGIDVKSACAQCNNIMENWICLTCYEVYCSRYVNKHMVAHTEETNHKITLSLSDASVWCYGCDDYVQNKVLDDATKTVFDSKYGSPGFFSDVL